MSNFHNILFKLFIIVIRLYENPNHEIVEKVFLYQEQNESYTYKEAELMFITNYDLENPITKR